MARVSISQTMLLLTHGRDIPVLERALPVFERVLDKNHLGQLSPRAAGAEQAQLHSRDKNEVDVQPLHQEGFSGDADQDVHSLHLEADVLGLDWLNDWTAVDWSMLGDFEMLPQTHQYSK